ncbi:MAG: hypothetical protein AB1457_17230 [Chloroflexota bacterium]|jgi:hypothetical protein
MTEDFRHQLWLIYEQLKDAESDPERQLELLTRSREELGQVINQLHRQAEPGLYALLASVGAKGGAAKTEAKAAAARSNGAKGGRPASTYFCRDCAPMSDDPDNARLIDCSGSPYAKKKECTECGGAVTYRLE